MAIEDNASIALIPSGYKSGKVYSVIPDDGDGDFTFSRSNTTATRVAASGLIENVSSNVPRLNYPLIDGVVQDCPHLLLEPSRTNYSIYSEDTSTWTYTEFGSGSAGTITTGKTDMFGGTNAVQVDFPSNAENVSVRFGHTSSSISSGTVSLTLYIKLVSSGSKNLQLRASASDIINVNSTEFVRYEVSGTKSSTEALQLKLRPSDGTSSGGFSIIICHPQEEVGSYPTSYIKTSGSQVTRSADLCNSAGTSAQVNNDAGAFFVEIQALEEGSSASRRITLSDESSSDRIMIETDESTGTFKFFIAGGGTVRTIATSTGNTQTDMNKLAIGYDGVNAKAYINGTQVGSITNATTRTGIDTIDIADWNGTSNVYYGRVKQVIYFNEALTDSELATLTS